MLRPRTFLVVSLLLLGMLSTSTAHAAGEQYALANGCFALKAPGGLVAKDGAGGYKAGAGAAEGFRMQATDLGKYLFYGKGRDFLAADGDRVRTAADASEKADWRVDPVSGGFRIQRPDTGKLLVAGDGGALALADAAAAGDRAVFTFEKTEGCAVFPEISTNATGTPSRGPVPFAATRGLVDAHMHMMAFEFLGGDVHCGRPWHPYGVTKALVDCPDHQTGAAPLETALGGKERHDPVGWPTFKDWPDNQSLTHEGSYYKWLERAWMGGLRVFVNLLVDNEVLCEVYPLKRNPCNEMLTVKLQSQRMEQLEDYIDAQNGGPGKGWFRIVRDPFEAREVINDGKLAVVKGIEVSKLFDCGEVNDVPQCDRAQIDRQLEEVHKLGVRDMELVNKLDNAFGGVAGDTGQTGVATNSANKQDTNHFWQMETCTGPADAQDRTQITAAGGPGRDELVGAFGQFFPPSQAPIYPAAPHCNARGLTELGDYLIRRMIERGMIIDPDHLSVEARNEVLSMIEAARYSGVISSHTWSTPDSFPRIYNAGGFITPYAGDSTKFVDEWKKTKPMANPRYAFGFGYGADMNGFGSQGDPRGAGAPNPVTYPFKSFDGAVTLDKQKSGERVYDINTDGVDHYGLYPDWIEDLRKLAGDAIVEDMARGSDAYLAMWERAVGVPANRCQPARARLTRGGIGRARLGDSAPEVLRRVGQPNARPDRGWTYCLQGPRDGRAPGELRPVFTEGGQLTLVASTGPEHEALGVGPGDRSSRLKGKRTRAFGRGIRVRNARGGARYVFGVRGARVRWVAVASEGASRTTAGLRAQIARAGLR